ncbi:MAG: hypothetical protein LBP53_02600 [Candidatus Peribacteria bacterium]|jgi:hypothetical protein|nr:hypothetical protein [Candidatus Peribacteria bacterium]
MKAIEDFLKEQGIEVSDANKIYYAFKAGVDVPLLKGKVHNTANIAKEVWQKIQTEGKDEDNNGKLDMLEKMEESYQKILKLKVETGLLGTITLDGQEYYHVNPAFFAPTDQKVLEGALWSNQINNLFLKENYTLEGKHMTIKSRLRHLEMLMKGFPLSFVRMYLGEKSLKEEKIIIVDKSVQYLFIYNSKTHEIEKKYKVGIAKGSAFRSPLSDKRVS